MLAGEQHAACGLSAASHEPSADTRGSASTSENSSPMVYHNRHAVSSMRPLPLLLLCPLLAPGGSLHHWCHLYVSILRPIGRLLCKQAAHAVGLGGWVGRARFVGVADKEAVQGCGPAVYWNVKDPLAAVWGGCGGGCGGGWDESWQSRQESGIGRRGRGSWQRGPAWAFGLWLWGRRA